VKQEKKSYEEISMGVKNAHSSFDKTKANLTVQRAAQKKKSLKPFAIGLDSAVTTTKPGIFMRSTKRVESLKRFWLHRLVY
jgi:hypothetical protein